MTNAKTNVAHRFVGSYKLEVPIDIHEKHEEGVSSYWMHGSNLLLQASANVRSEGRQVAARNRLDARLAAPEWKKLKAQQISLVNCEDVAAAYGNCDEGLHWWFIYLTWPDVAVLLTLSNDAPIQLDPDCWAWRVVASVKPL